MVDATVIRAATSVDAESIAQVQVTSYRTAYAPHFPPGFWNQMTLEEQAEEWRTWQGEHPRDELLVAEVSGAVVGYVLARPHEYFGTDAEVLALHVLPEHQRSGHARALLAAALARLVVAGGRSVGLSTLERNPVRRWYEALDGQVVGVTEEEVDGWKVREVVYRWNNLRQLQERLLDRDPDGVDAAAR